MATKKKMPKVESPMLDNASVILFQHFFTYQLHLLLARQDIEHAREWGLYKQSGMSTHRMPLLNGAAFEKAEDAYQAAELIRQEMLAKAKERREDVPSVRKTRRARKATHGESLNPTKSTEGGTSI